MTTVEIWAVLAVVANLLVAIASSIHILLTKSEARAATGWLGLVWLSPYIGAFIYIGFGINRINRRAHRLRLETQDQYKFLPGDAGKIPDTEIFNPENQNISRMARHIGQITRTPLVAGNRIVPLENGDQAYPVMLAAIREAKQTIALCSYIFDYDHAGKQFVEALIEARQRGVSIRVLIDAVGAHYSKKSTAGILSKADIETALFSKSRIPMTNPYVNLRNHRKLLIVDATDGFTGGLNIREGCLLERASEHPVQDLHFHIQGPVVNQLTATFALDWLYTTKTELESSFSKVEASAVGNIHARSIPDGPDEDIESIRRTLLGALANAQNRVLITSPYFLPGQALMTALNTAVLRGVEIDIVIPEKSNLGFIQRAMSAQANRLLETGCRIWLSPPPFDHSKLMVVDDYWTLFGSANWDARSLRLNFEFNLECYDQSLCKNMIALVENKIANSNPLTREEIKNTPIGVKLFNRLIWLFSPYL